MIECFEGRFTFCEAAAFRALFARMDITLTKRRPTRRTKTGSKQPPLRVHAVEVVLKGFDARLARRESWRQRFVLACSQIKPTRSQAGSASVFVQQLMQSPRCAHVIKPGHRLTRSRHKMIQQPLKRLEAAPFERCRFDVQLLCSRCSAQVPVVVEPLLRPRFRRPIKNPSESQSCLTWGPWRCGCCCWCWRRGGGSSSTSSGISFSITSSSSRYSDCWRECRGVEHVLRR